MKTLYTRCDGARKILLEEKDVNRIIISGGCRAYLDAFSDYMNPLLIEMDKVEEMLLKTKKYYIIMSPHKDIPTPYPCL